jgi:hypothetical protein
MYGVCSTQIICNDVQGNTLDVSAQWESGGVTVNLIQETFTCHVVYKNKIFTAFMQGNNSEEAWVRQY